LQVTIVPPEPLEPPLAAAVVAGAAAVPLAEPEAERLLFTPPCPLQAPRPVLVDVVPSLQVTVVAGEVLEAPLVEPLVLDPVLLAAAPALLLLSTPPCPLQAPRPLLADVVPSLQVTPVEVVPLVCA
jgi:hypothetical protein